MDKVNILLDILKSRGNQGLKFGQLIEYNVRSFFFKNHRKN